MFCSNCGNKLPDGAKFCNSCGVAVVSNTATTEERKTAYDGEVRKCPNCGDVIDAYETVCETCGYEIRGRKATSVVYELALKLESIYDIKKREELIRNFYIPNTKEDIYEFFILATSNIESRCPENDAWISKLEQTYQKAKLTFKGTQELEYFRLLYENAKKANRIRIIIKLSKSKYSWMAVLGIFALIFWLIYAIFNAENFGTIGLICLVAIMWIGMSNLLKNDNK